MRSSLKHLFAVAAALICMLGLQAQSDDLLLFGSDHDINRAALFPSTFGQTEAANFWVTLPSIHAYGGADFIQNREAREILNGGQIPSELIDDVVNRMDSRNRIFAGAQISPFALGWKINREGKELFSMHFSVTEQAFAKINISDKLAQIAWYGNKGFAGEEVDLSPIEGDAIWRRSFRLGFGVPLWQDENMSVRGGANINFVQGIVSAHGHPVSATVNTAADGSSLDYDFILKGRISGTEEIDPLKGVGSGLSLDLGTSVNWGNRFSLDFSFLDMGAVRLDGDVKTATVQGENIFEGLIIDYEDGVTFEIDSFSNYADVEGTESGTFYQNLSSRMLIRFGYAMGQTMDRLGLDYARHRFYGSYEQGFVEGPRSSFAPRFTAAYVFTHNGFLELGTSMGWAHEDIDLGAFVSIQGGPFQFGIGANDFAGLIFGGSKANADVSMQMGLRF
jgi:hypothetical protein